MTLPAALYTTLGGEWTRLSGGLSHEVWRVDPREGASLTVRMADSGIAARLFARDPQAEWDALTALRGTGIAPEPVQRIGGAVVTEFITGTPWTGAFAAVGAALRRLHAQSPPDSLPTAPRCAIRLGEDILAQCSDRALLDVRPNPAPLLGPDVFLHGDPVPGNIVMQGEVARLIDWQCPARGPALHDIALFLSPAMQIVGRGQVPSDEDRAAFFAGYGEAVAGEMAPLHWCIACHCQWRIEQGHEAYRAALAAELTALGQATRLP